MLSTAASFAMARALGRPMAISAFSPVSLFTSGSQGVWLDPSDLTTMFTDRAGTTPVTAPGQTVGKRLDKSGRGNHATAPTDTARLIYGVEPKTGRRNLLTFTEQLSNAVWPKSSVTVTDNVATDPLGAAADKAIPSVTSDGKYWTQNPGFTSSGAWTFSRVVKNDGYNFYAIALQNSGLNSAFYNLTTGAITSIGANVTATSAVDLGNGFWRVSLTTTQAIGYVQEYVSATASFAAMTGNGTSGIIVGGSQWEAGSTATAYQRVTTAYDVTESGVPTCHYCQYDGSDDSMSTAAIDFTATDKMSVFAGVRKLSDVTEQILYELSASAFANPNSFAMYAGDNGTARGAFWTGLNHGNGTPASAEYSAVAGAPVSTMLTALLAIQSTPRTVIRTNGTVIGTLTGTADAGSFGNWPLFIGRRNNASFPFNGKDYGIIVVGKTASAAEIASTEAYLAANTSGVTLP